MSHRRAALALVAAVALACPACSGIGVRRAKDRALFADFRASTLSADRLSPRCLQTLRRLDLDHVYAASPDAAAGRLHDEAIRDPQPDTLFALAEVHYLSGRAAENKRPDLAVGHFVRCCGYAQHFLLATSAGESPHQPGFAAASAEALSCVRPVLTPRDGFDPGFGVACTL
jgi:hypothetical protein